MSAAAPFALPVYPLSFQAHRLATLLDRVLAENPELPRACHGFTRGGKRLRARLLFAAAAPRATPAVQVPVLRTAAAVELLQAASLVHDDIVDRCPTRRGLPALYRTEGVLHATATGAATVQIALVLLAELPALVRTRVAEAARRLGRGQFMEIVQAYDAGVSPEGRLEIVQEKTASVFAVACEPGGILTSAAHSYRSTLRWVLHLAF